jgi:hypothetical protein
VAAGSPWENGYVESFHSRLRDEFLERVIFEDVADVRAKAAWYRREYNAVRPHSSLGCATPKEFRVACDRRINLPLAKIDQVIDGCASFVLITFWRSSKRLPATLHSLAWDERSMQFVRRLSVKSLRVRPGK